MPVTYTLDGKLFRMDFEGAYGSEEIKDVFASALEDPDFPDDARFLMDVTRSSTLASRPAENLRDVANFLGPRSERVGHRCAIVVGEPVQYGLMRMVQVFGEEHGVDTAVFSTLEEALLWLGLEREVAQPDGAG